MSGFEDPQALTPTDINPESMVASVVPDHPVDPDICDDIMDCLNVSLPEGWNGTVTDWGGGVVTPDDYDDPLPTCADREILVWDEALGVWECWPLKNSVGCERTTWNEALEEWACEPAVPRDIPSFIPVWWAGVLLVVALLIGFAVGKLR
jgi:hypothetical protein